MDDATRATLRARLLDLIVERAALFQRSALERAARDRPAAGSAR